MKNQIQKLENKVEKANRKTKGLMVGGCHVNPNSTIEINAKSTIPNGLLAFSDFEFGGRVNPKNIMSISLHCWAGDIAQMEVIAYGDGEHDKELKQYTFQYHISELKIKSSGKQCAVQEHMIEDVSGQWQSKLHQYRSALGLPLPEKCYECNAIPIIYLKDWNAKWVSACECSNEETNALAKLVENIEFEEELKMDLDGQYMKIVTAYNKHNCEGNKL